MQSLSLIISLSLLPALLLGGDLNEIVQTGDDYFQTGEYENAITEYRRFLYFSPVDSLAYYTIYKKIGKSFLYLDKKEQAMQSVNVSLSYAPNESTFVESALLKVTLNIAQQKFDLAQQNILTTQLNISAPNHRKALSLYESINQLHRFHWKESKTALKNYWDGPAEHQWIDSLYHSTESIPLKNPQLAKNLSLVLPGLGQLYGRDYINGIKAVVLDGLLFYNFGYAYNSGKIINTLIGGVLLLNRYIVGNRDHALKITQKYNRNLQNREVKKIMRAIKDEVTE